MVIGRGRRREHPKDTSTTGVAQLPVGHAHIQGNNEKKGGENNVTSGHVTDVTSVHVTSGDVLSGDVTSGSTPFPNHDGLQILKTVEVLIKPLTCGCRNTHLKCL
jgi:N-acetylmuramic acid 6-phosphate (MurNAc-6-P) etherase